MSRTSFYQRKGCGQWSQIAKRDLRTLLSFMILISGLFSWILVVSEYSFLLYICFIVQSLCYPLRCDASNYYAISHHVLFGLSGSAIRTVSLSTAAILLTHQYSPISSFVMIIPVYYYFRHFISSRILNSSQCPLMFQSHIVFIRIA